MFPSLLNLLTRNLLTLVIKLIPSFLILSVSVANKKIKAAFDNLPALASALDVETISLSAVTEETVILASEPVAEADEVSGTQSIHALNLLVLAFLAAFMCL
jgi:hypothetical protein